jgi:hypothetical protein
MLRKDLNPVINHYKPGIFLVEEVNLNDNAGDVVLLRVDLVGRHVNVLVQGEDGPFPLQMGK